MNLNAMLTNEYTSQGPNDQLNFCSKCGVSLTFRIPPGDDRPRYVCDDCLTIHYQNPKMVVGAIPVWEDKVLLCQRAIEPQYGKWTLPAGYLENGESVENGAIRETREEAGATIDIVQPFALYSLTFVSHIYFMFYAKLYRPNFSPGEESLSVKLFSEEDIPWEEISFKVIKKTLTHFFIDRRKGKFSFHMGDIAQR